MTVRWLTMGMVCLAFGCGEQRARVGADGGPVADAARLDAQAPDLAAPDAMRPDAVRPDATAQSTAVGDATQDAGVHQALGSNLLGRGPLKNAFGDKRGFDSKLNAAMSGVGEQMVVARGAGGMGIRGTGGGGQGFGRIYGMGRIDTGGGRGVRMQAPARERWTRRPGPRGFVPVAAQPLSTLSIDADSASYSLMRSSLSNGRRPQPASVFIEDFVNRFDYGDAPPTGGRPLRVTADVGAAPWAPGHRLVRIGVKAAEVSEAARKAANLVFLVDVSGSMTGPDRLPLVQQGLRAMVEHLRPDDRVAIVTYAGAAGLVLPSTPARDAPAILAALERLKSGGTTAGGAGIELAYRVAAKHFVKGGNNRVVLATDGDFNVGVQSRAGLLTLIKAKRKTGVLLTMLGVGRGNLRAQRMEAIAQHGDGGFHFLDGPKEAQRILVDELTRTLVTVARDVKVQVEFNPAQVKAYRLLGYENRLLAAQDFNDDTKDAGELQAGHTVSVLYELIPAGSDEAVPGVDQLKYQARAAKGGAELLTVKVRAKHLTAKRSKKWSVAVRDTRKAPSQAMRFASAVVELALLLREDEHRGAAGFPALIARAKGALGDDIFGARAEFVALAGVAANVPQGSARARPRTSRAVQLRRGTATYDGTCRPQDVERVFRRRQRGIQYCYEKELARSPTLKGEAVLRWTIERTGQTSGVTAEDRTLQSEVVTGCMVRSVQRWRFAATAEPCEVTQPVVFSAAL